MTIRLALIAMGYREVDPGRWLKPIGYQLFSYSESKNEWNNWLKGADGKIHCYQSKVFRENFGSYLAQLKDWECFTRTDIVVNGGSYFELSAIDL